MQPGSWAPLTAFAAALLAVAWLSRSSLSKALLDQPNARSLHKSPVPRTGGLGLHAGALLAIGVISPSMPPMLWVGLGIVIAISLLDDVRGIAPLWRLTELVVASGLLMEAILGSHGIIAVAVATITTVWMANLYNFMDGADGLAGGMAVIGFSFYGIAAFISSDADLALISLSIAAAAAGFLIFNFHPARVFLGDAGSVPLGFLAAALGIMGCLRESWTWWFPALVFSPFIADASITLARRLMRLEKIWQPHRDHYYQRLVRMGWGHRKTALVEYAVMLAVGAIALAAMQTSGVVQAAALAGVTLAYLGLMAAIERRWAKFERAARA